MSMRIDMTSYPSSSHQHTFTSYEEVIRKLERRIDLMESVIMSSDELRTEYEKLLIIEKLKGKSNE